MRVLCCYTALPQPVLDALDAHAPGAELIHVTHDPYAYWAAITARWGRGDDLVIIEHDIEIHAGVIPGFAGCPGLWCLHTYQLPGRDDPCDRGLGCTRFSAWLQDRITPAQIETVRAGTCEDCRRDDRRGCWRHIDGHITAAFDQHLGLRTPHIHDPPVTHHHPAG